MGTHLFKNLTPQATKHWAALKQLAQGRRALTLSTLLRTDPQRFSQFAFELPSLLLLDLSKQHLTPTVLSSLIAWAHEMELSSAIQALWTGKRVNHTEDRAALHMALRAPLVLESGPPGLSVQAEIHRTLARMERFCRSVIAGEWVGYSGQPIRDVVNIGIGGSDLGPVLLCEALAPYRTPLKVHFLSNVDGDTLTERLRALSPASTLFIVASKSFTTQETLLNAEQARDWLCAAAGDGRAVSQHFVGVSAHPEAMSAFGIPPALQFPIWEWVGGRYSIWSAIGLPVALAIGFEPFQSLLRGAHALDTHFVSAPFEENLPVLFALSSLWNTQFLEVPTEVVLPYSDGLRSLPAYLQQLTMESNGKSVDRSGVAVQGRTSPIVWGGVGTNAQHAFFQLLHQGTHPVSCEFIVPAKPRHGLHAHHACLLAHCFAQSRALALGSESAAPDETAVLRLGGLSPEAGRDLPYRLCPGNQPSSTIVLESLSPFCLGGLLALYEHKVFVQGVLLNIFSFDQFGVELGKCLATPLLTSLLEASDPVSVDPSTSGLIRYVQARWTPKP